MRPTFVRFPTASACAYWARENDPSLCGRSFGEAPLPNVRPGVNVKTFGAKGVGAADDTAAFLEAIQEAKGAIGISAGGYRITDIFKIKLSGVVVRGAGPDRTILLFPNPLQAVFARSGLWQGMRLQYAGIGIA